MKIYDQVGGGPAFARLALALHERCVADPVLNHPFDRPDLKPDHLERLASYLAEVFGGPPVYSRSYGGETAMQEVHACNEPQVEMYGRFLDCFVTAIDDAGFADEPGLRTAMRSFMETALARMQAYAPAGSTVPPDLPMPHA
jgi:hemoglobin